MKLLAFASRNTKEMVRDKVNMMFGLGFPAVLLLLLSAIQANIPVSMFEISTLTPGIAVFGLSFISLFSATLISKDRSSSLVLRLYTSPLRAVDFILGYTMPLLVMAAAQVLFCLLVSAVLGLKFQIANWLMMLVATVPAMILYIGLGLLCGTLLNDKQVGGVCGALLTNLSAWLSGTWFDVSLVGGVFEGIANALPFIHAVNAGRAALTGNWSAIFPEIWWVIGYAVGILVVAVIIFTRKMYSDNNGK